MPSTADVAETHGAITSMTPNRSVSRCAVAPGMMSMATTSTTPTTCRAATEVTASSPSSSPPRNRGERPIACACWGSNA